MKPLELVGNILGYFPGISSVVGIIKYFVYTSKVRECEKERDEMARTAEKVDEIITPQFRESRTERADALDQEILSYNELAWCSGGEIVPFFNIFFSIFETAELNKLDESRRKLDVADQHENLDADTKITNLEARIGVKLPEEEGPKRDYCLKALATLDNLRIDGTHAIELKKNIYNQMESGWPDGPQNVVGDVKGWLHVKMIDLARQLRLEPPYLYDPRLHLSRENDQFYMFVSIKIAIKTLDGIIAKDPEEKIGVKLPEEEGPKRDYCQKALKILDTLDIQGKGAESFKKIVYNNMAERWSPDGPQYVVEEVKRWLEGQKPDKREKYYMDSEIARLEEIIRNDPEGRIGVKLPEEVGPKRDYCVNVLTELDTLNFEGEHGVFRYIAEKRMLVERRYNGNQFKQLMYESIEKKLRNDDPRNHNALVDILQDLEKWNSRIRAKLGLDENPPNNNELERPENQESVKMLHSIEEAIRTLNERILQEE